MIIFYPRFFKLLRMRWRQMLWSDYELHACEDDPHYYSTQNWGFEDIECGLGPPRPIRECSSSYVRSIEGIQKGGLNKDRIAYRDARYALGYPRQFLSENIQEADAGTIHSHHEIKCSTDSEGYCIHDLCCWKVGQHQSSQSEYKLIPNRTTK